MRTLYICQMGSTPWVFFICIVCDPVEAKPPVNTFLLNATLSGSSYALNEGGEFDKQTFGALGREGHNMPSSYLGIICFAC